MESMITDVEYTVIHRKELNPNERVCCPRCGKPLSYQEIGNSYEVKCPTLDCIKMTVRGL